MRMINNKRGSTDFPEQIIFITLNIVLFLLLMAFMWKYSSGAIIYEQSYSKQIALLIDSAKPGTTYLFDVRDGMKTLEKGKVREDSIKIDNENKEVIVLFSGTSGYKFRYFADYNVDYEIKGDYIIIRVGDKHE